MSVDQLLPNQSRMGQYYEGKHDNHCGYSSQVAGTQQLTVTGGAALH